MSEILEAFGRKVVLVPDPSPPREHKVQLRHGEHVTAEDACFLLCITRNTLDRYFERGWLLKRKFGGGVFIPLDDVKAVIARQGELNAAAEEKVAARRA